MSRTQNLKPRRPEFKMLPFKNDMGRTDDRYAPDGTIWGALTVVAGRTESLPGEAERAAVTHKLTIRPRACRLTTATYFEYQGQRYDVQYWQPHYKRRDRLEVFLKLVIEDGA